MRVVVADDGRPTRSLRGTDFISSMPVTELVEKLDAAARRPGAARRPRGCTIATSSPSCLIVNERDLFPDNWIYIHSPEVKVGRIQNFKNWSPDMVPDAGKTSLGLEYFCTEGDALWDDADDELVELAEQELRADRAGDGRGRRGRLRVRHAQGLSGLRRRLRERLDVDPQFVDSFANLQTVGRNGMHRYNNQDHSMLTGMLAVRNILGEKHDLWTVNAEQEYHEEGRDADPGDAAAGICGASPTGAGARASLNNARRRLSNRTRVQRRSHDH